MIYHLPSTHTFIHKVDQSSSTIIDDEKWMNKQITSMSHIWIHSCISYHHQSNPIYWFISLTAYISIHKVDQSSSTIIDETNKQHQWVKYEFMINTYSCMSHHQSWHNYNNIWMNETYRSNQSQSIDITYRLHTHSSIR